MAAPDNQTALQQYIRFYEALSPQMLEHLGEIFTADARFKDPFNDVRGVDKIRKVFDNMFKTVGVPQFRVTDWGFSDQDKTHAFLRWHFIYRVGGKGEPVVVEGMSDVTFAPDHKVSSHLDFWDAGQGLYEHLPIIGAVLRMIRKRVEA